MNHHRYFAAAGMLVPSAALGSGVPIPYYLAANRRLLRSVAKGATIRCGDVELEESPSSSPCAGSRTEHSSPQPNVG